MSKIKAIENKNIATNKTLLLKSLEVIMVKYSKKITPTKKNTTNSISVNTPFLGYKLRELREVAFEKIE